jgi:predicted DNA-binding protein with PD1-like motif
MRFKQIDDSPTTFILVFETGDELASGLLQFAKERRLSSASFKAVGALSSVQLEWFNWETKAYDPAVTLDEQVEVLSLIGDVALKGEEPVVHAHVVIGKRDGTAHGGHLARAIVRPTCEVVLTVSPVAMQKSLDRGSGLYLIDVGDSGTR